MTWEEWLVHHALVGAARSEVDDGEVRFVRLVLSKVEGLKPEDVQPRFGFTADDRGRTIDFAVMDGQAVVLALVIDGFFKEEKDGNPTDEEVIDFLSAQPSLAGSARSLLRFTHVDVEKTPADVRGQIESRLAEIWQTRGTTPLSASERLPQVGDVVHGTYELVRLLGQGGFGQVFLGRHRHLGHEVALKMLIPMGDPDRRAQDVKQFLQEARLLRELAHPRLPAVSDFFEDRQTAFMVMDYIPGDSLQKVVEREGALSEERVLDIVHQICSVFEYVHSLTPPIVVRDLKPDNLMLSHGQVYVIDFGIAKKGDETTVTSAACKGLGTAGYCPIEQYSGGTSPRSDYYALGATMLFLLTKKVPPAADVRARGVDLADPTLGDAPVSAQTWSTIQALMQMNPEARPGSVEEIRRLLTSRAPHSTARPVSTGGAIAASPYTIARKATGVLVGLLLCGLGVVGIAQLQPTLPPSGDAGVTSPAPPTPPASVSTPTCPRCEKPMVPRTRKSNGHRFWGCPDFPRCRGTRDMTSG